MPTGIYPRKKFHPDNYLHCIDKESTDCWIWFGHRSSRGYGLIKVNRINSGAHRRFYKFYKGEIMENFDLDHLCRNPACVNPKHLEPVSRSTNMRRGIQGRDFIRSVISIF